MIIVGIVLAFALAVLAHQAGARRQRRAWTAALSSASPPETAADGAASPNEAATSSAAWSAQKGSSAPSGKATRGRTSGEKTAARPGRSRGKAAVRRGASRGETAARSGSTPDGAAAPAFGSAAEGGRYVARLVDRLAGLDAELVRLRQDREDQIRMTEQEQRSVNHRLRRRAKDAIDDTGAVITQRLGAVVEQVGAARQAATDTQERVGATSHAASEMVRRARSADEAAATLNSSLHEVAGIAHVISEIASQTRMLALNATIEAARAGSAGKGFAVVADEVKSLADTTATSSGQIATTIATLESDVAKMSRTLATIVQDVGEIESAMGLLDGIAEDQHAIVERLNDTVGATMDQIQDLSDVAERLERRRAERLTASGPVRLRTRRGVEEGQLVDLSTGGFGCIVPPATPIQSGDRLQAELELSGGRVMMEAEVVRRRPIDGGIELGLRMLDAGDDAKRRIAQHVQRALEAS